jgi:glycosyltransferase involved in cell wall biosynthesis
MRHADVMVFNSEYMHEAYRANSGCDARRSVVSYQGIGDAIFQAASETTDSLVRRRHRIVTVSAMGPHKGVETSIKALAIVRDKHGIPADLKLIGTWPDSAYRASNEQLVRQLGLENAVHFAGHVPLAELHQSYAEARIFCLMSYCESFGFPAIEAQAFGTPVVTSNRCAMPEIDGDGGVYAEAGDAEATAEALVRLLVDDAEWAARSQAAKQNAERFRWDLCARKLQEALAGDGNTEITK